MSRLFLIIIFCLLIFRCLAQNDGGHHLKQVNVTAKKFDSSYLSLNPFQNLRDTDLSRMNVYSVADAVKYFSGVQVKDYGGIGGFKSINVRSLGANHTGISYDGLMLSDVQNGQIDLGKFPANSFTNISLTNAEPNNLLQSARAFSYASVLELTTDNISDNQPKRNNYINKGLTAGSFGLIEPFVNLRHQFSKKFSTTFSTDWQYANGQYNFSYVNNDSTEKARRLNADIKALKLSASAKYLFANSVLNADVYAYNSQRGLPNSIVYYNYTGGQRYWDNDFFAQASWQKKISTKSNLLLLAKYNAAYNKYVDTTFLNSAGMLKNVFWQREFYTSAAFKQKLFSFMDVAIGSDFFINNLHSEQSNFINPKRYTWLNNISTKINFAPFVITANLLSTIVNNTVENGSKPPNMQAHSPSVSLGYKPIKNIPLRIRSFYKSIFRMPTFNDLYYTNVGNTNLKPEDTKQWDIGVTWQQNLKHSVLQNFLLTTDVYYNNITNMILAIPQQNLAQWSMQNIGKVQIKGLDITSKFYFKPIQYWHFSLFANYSFQQAINMTNPQSALYKNQIPYTPKNFGSFNLLGDYKKFSFGYNALFSGYRYINGQNSYATYLAGWSTQDLSVAYHYTSKKEQIISFKFQLNNLFNQQYQVVKYYPMPGRNFKLSISLQI